MNRSRTIVSALAIALVLVAAACGSSGGSGPDAGGSGSSTNGSKAPVALSGKVTAEGSADISSKGDTAKVEIEMDDNSFKPTYIKAAPGATVTVELKNEGANTHTFTLDDGSVDKTMDPGSTASVTVTVPESGSLRFSCNFHGSMGMQGAFYTGTAGASAATSTTAASSGGGSGY